mmetsp:Transcript_22659/g.26020  ORF Transcript_22659/g.26020 Transcript_22659/m.26020 type:complete len:86 (+) Transcript_22659:155-412(+)
MPPFYRPQQHSYNLSGHNQPTQEDIEDLECPSATSAKDHVESVMQKEMIRVAGRELEDSREEGKVEEVFEGEELEDDDDFEDDFE